MRPNHHREAARERAPCYRGGRAYGQEKNVCFFSQSRTGSGVPGGPCLCRAAVRNRLVPGERVRARRMKRVGIIAAMPGELKPLVQGWTSLPLPHGENAWQGTVEGSECIAVCAGMGRAAAERACAIAMREAPLNTLVSMGWAGALSCGLPPGAAYVVNE